MVPVLSSAARIPLPGAVIASATASKLLKLRLMLFPLFNFDKFQFLNDQ
jgi:hypothetical protein